MFPNRFHLGGAPCTGCQYCYQQQCLVTISHGEVIPRYAKNNCGGCACSLIEKANSARSCYYTCHHLHYPTTCSVSRICFDVVSSGSSSFIILRNTSLSVFNCLKISFSAGTPSCVCGALR